VCPGRGGCVQTISAPEWIEVGGSQNAEEVSGDAPEWRASFLMPLYCDTAEGGAVL